MSDDTKYLLVTTALEESWRGEENLVLLGEWCRLYSERAIINAKCHEVLPYHWDDSHKVDADFRYLQLLNKELISDLTKILNDIHHKNYTEKTWSILIGCWLVKFTAIVLDRWSMIDFATKNYEFIETISLNIDRLDCVPNDTQQSVDFFLDDEWNHALCIQLIETFHKIKIKYDNKILDNKLRKKDLENVPTSLKLKLKKILRPVLITIKNSIFRSGTYIFDSTFLGLMNELKINLSLGWAVSYKAFLDPPLKKYDDNFRNWTISKKGADEFETTLRRLIPKFMPKIFLEGFENCHDKNTQDSFACKTQVIFTATSHFYNDSFKVYAMDKVHKGSKLVIAQHGGGCLNRYEAETDFFELLIADKYLSPGSANEKINNKIINVGQVFNRQKYHNYKPYNKRTDAILVTVAMPRYVFSMISAAKAGQMISYFEDQFLFYQGLTEHVREHLLVRLYSEDYGWDQRQRWIDNFADIKFDNNPKMTTSAKKARLVIGTYSATTFNETLASNTPTVVYWDSNYWQLNSVSDPYFEELVKVGIFHNTPESASRQVVNVWDDIEKWWYDPELQAVRQKYCKAFADQTDGLINNIKVVLQEQRDIAS